METRYVTVPEAIELVVENPATGKIAKTSRDFYALVKERTNDHGHFGKTLDSLMLGLSIRQAFIAAKAGDIIGLPLEQWEALCKAVREPSNGYNPEVMFQMLPMVKAIIDAPSTRPETKSIDLGKPEVPEKPEGAATN